MNESLASIATPEPTEVKLSFNCCPEHSYNYVSMPRDSGGDSRGFLFKCPLRKCGKGEVSLTESNF